MDASTLEFLGQFLAEGLHDRILTVLTFRPEFQTPWPAVAHQTSLALNRLTRRQVGDLMRKKAGAAAAGSGGRADLRPGRRRAAVRRRVHEDGARVGTCSTRSGDRRRAGQGLAGPRDPRHAPGPGDGPPGPAWRATGRWPSSPRCSAASSATSCSPPSPTVDEPTLQAELAKLVQAEILYPKGRPPRCTYIFKHALLRRRAV